MEQGKIMEAEVPTVRVGATPTGLTPRRFFTSRMPFLPPNQQRQSTEGTVAGLRIHNKKSVAQYGKTRTARL